MSQYLIRPYKDCDYEMVRHLFACGNKEHMTESFKHGIRQPYFCLPLLTLLILPLWDIVSFTTAILAVATGVSLMWLAVWQFFQAYIQSGLSQDLRDIEKYYMKQDGRCFWVAESGGRVVGTVAAAPSPFPGGENHMELKRLSVAKSHRGRGVAKALSRTMFDFARQRRGCEAVILTTNIVQIDAWKMYEKMGFRLERTFYLPLMFIKLFGLKSMFYRVVMSQFTIRPYKDSDYHMVRGMYAINLMEHVNTAFSHALQLPRIYLPLLSLVLLPMLNTAFLTTSILALAAIIVCLWLGARHIYQSFVNAALSDDLLDIQKHYMDQENCCFWVVELGEEVVGTVGALPSSFPSEKNHLEIKRLSVSKSHRRKGLAKALVRTTVDFARKGGFRTVIARTTSAQVDALRLYEKLGFRLSRVFYRPMALRKLLGLKSMFYEYDIPQNQ